MTYALIALLAAVLLVLSARAFAYAGPGQVVRVLQRGVAIATMGLGVLLALRGAFAIAVPVFFMGMGLLRMGNLGGMRFPWTRRTPGQRSTVRTRLLVMELDHDTGAIDGEVLAPPWTGRRLSELNARELQELLETCRGEADQSATLLEAYLDHAHPDWRSEGSEAGEQPSTAPASSGVMTPDEARAVLGVGRDASDAEVRAAHRRLMKTSHPDHGGTDYLATKINQAKDVLLGKAGGRHGVRR